jgi:hypothetical protein
VVYWPSGFLEAWGAKAKKNTLVLENISFWPCGKATATSIFMQRLVFWPWYPRLPKKHLANKPLAASNHVGVNA